MIDPEPQKEHRWLQRMVGEWTSEATCSMGPDQRPSTVKGKETVRTLGGLWVLAEGQGEMPDGGPANTVMTLGYDPQKKRFVGPFIGSMMTHLWPYDGALDAAERVLTLDSEGRDFTGEKMAKYQDIIEFRSDDHRVVTSRLLGDDGMWNQFMEAHYRRQP
ncbi:MAG: DUF1579 domain-containing protein [Gammaproteobacteria bacterium]